MAQDGKRPCCHEPARHRLVHFRHAHDPWKGEKDKRPCLKSSPRDEKNCADNVHDARQRDSVSKQYIPQLERKKNNGKPCDERENIGQEAETAEEPRDTVDRDPKEWRCRPEQESSKGDQISEGMSHQFIITRNSCSC